MVDYNIRSFTLIYSTIIDSSALEDYYNIL